MGLYHRVHGCVSYGAWVCIIHGGYGVHHTVDTSQKSGIEECHSHDIDEDSSDTDRDIWDPRWMLMRIKAISRMAFISEGVWRIEEEMLFRGCMTQLICYYLIHGNHVVNLDERMNKEFKEDIRKLLNLFQVVEHPDEMQKDGISLPRLAFVFQGLTARIRLAIGKAKGEDLIEPRGQYGRMPKLFELRELAGTAALYGFEAEHLQWVLDRDEKTNPKPNPGKVKRNHRTASRMEDFHVDLNAALTCTYPNYCAMKIQKAQLEIQK
eukprot:GHVO01018504.1.p1 GENE.GHVO01018504.1~~GHVO01018504.1.p1  ORF type:complete len:266 (+),score=43.59 GHVO01018504.1:123-920(+)